MPHASEGKLHAFLDGALQAADPAAARILAEHVEACRDCRARLDAARAVRDRSAALLEVALGDAVEPPGFDAVLREAEARGVGGGASPGDRRASRMLRRFAWAASIVVALGAGWMANAVRQGRDLSAPREPFAPAVRLEESAADRLEVVAGEPAAAGADVIGSPARVSATEADRTLSPVPADDRPRAEDRPARQEATEGAPAFAQAPRRGRLTAEAAEESAAAPPPGAAEEREGGIRRVLADAGEASKAAGAESLARLEGFSDRDLNEAAWRPLDQDAAAAFVGGELARIPELEILDVGVVEWDGRRFARVRQRLPGGEILVILHEGARPLERRAERADEPEPVSRDEALRVAPEIERVESEEPQPVSSSGWVESGRVRIRIAAPVASDSLAALLSRIR